MAVTVKGLKSGPFEISGGVTILDHSGKEYADTGEPVYLCRCGRRTNLIAMATTKTPGSRLKKPPDKKSA